MAIKGKTFDLQTITAKDDGALYRILSGESDMIVFSGSGTALSINSNILTIAECYLLVGGRYIHIEDGSTIDLGTIPNSSNRGRVIIKVDTSLGATQVTLDQVVTEIETIASGGSYRALVKNDINSDNGGSVYEIEFATFTCSSGVASSPALTTSVPTQTKIQALQDDIDILADNLEQTASDVGDLQDLGLSVPIPVNKGGSGLTSSPSMLTNLASTAVAGIFQASPRPGVTGTLPIGNGGTGASTQAGAQSNLGILPYKYFTSSYAFAGITAVGVAELYAACNSDCIVRPTFTDGLKPLAIVNWGNANYGCVTFFCQRPLISMQQWQVNGGTWTNVTDNRSIVQFKFEKTAYSRFGYSNLQILTRTDIMGAPNYFTTATTDYWNIQLQPGVYRMDLYASFQSSSAIPTDVGIGLGNNANRRATPIEARVQTTGSITKLNASGVLKVTSYDDLYSYLVYIGDTTARDIGGYWTIERIG